MTAKVFNIGSGAPLRSLLDEVKAEAPEEVIVLSRKDGKVAVRAAGNIPLEVAAWMKEVLAAVLTSSILDVAASASDEEDPDGV